MAEESFLVNFDTAPSGGLPALSSQVPHVKGGRWKDRFKAKKLVQHRARKGLAKELNAASTGSTESPKNNNGKRERIHESSSDSKPQVEARFESRQRQAKLKRKRQSEDCNGIKRASGHQSQVVISSLFSSNPETNAGADTTDIDGLVPVAPTNAPLNDGSAFSALGLTPALASHLAVKMNLKAPTCIQRAAIPQLITSDSDAFIQAETGSGKTLAYLLPLIHRITFSPPTANPEQKLHRDSGCFAIILAPTRELGRQIHFVLNQVLSQPSLHWIVPILLLGGEKKKSEKARLRKGGNILVATPGRLADHLQNTKSLNVSKVRWLILDEGDRLMDLGFEDTIRIILDLLKERCISTVTPAPSDGHVHHGPALVPNRRATILCSATIQGNAQRLGEISLSEALFLKSDQAGNLSKGLNEAELNVGEFSAPAQLQQSYIVTPAKLRLVTLAAILKRAFLKQRQTTKVVVFFCCGQSVDFHFSALSAHFDEKAKDEDEDNDEDNAEDKDKSRNASGDVGADSPSHADTISSGPFSKNLSLDPKVELHKLHGSLKQSVRTATMSSFLHGKGSAILFCTDIAARGLDLPDVDLVVQYDPPFSKEDYLHRIGRTARAGRDGRATLFLMPGSEERYPSEVLTNMKISRKTAAEVLKLGFGLKDAAKSSGGKHAKKHSSSSLTDSDFIPMTSGELWAEEATKFHLSLERWALADSENLALARRGFQSFVGAYATHIASERSIFDLKALHLGHIAKSFCLRDKPADIKLMSVKPDASQGSTSRSRGDVADQRQEKKSVDQNRNSINTTDEEAQNNARRMMAKMNAHMSAISEFNIG